MTRLLIRDLEQAVSPAGRDAPLRGARLRERELIEGAYVLCDGETIAAVGSMTELPALDGDVEELDGRGLCAIPGLVDCHTHPAFGGDRVEEFSRRAGRRELRGAARRGPRHPLDRRCDPGRRRGRPRRGRAASPRLDAPRGHDDLRGKVGLRPRSRDRACVAAGDRSGRWDPDLARGARHSARVREPRRLSRLPSGRRAP